MLSCSYTTARIYFYLHSLNVLKKILYSQNEQLATITQPVRLNFQPFIFSQPAVFFSHNKPANSTFSRLFSAKRIILFLALLFYSTSAHCSSELRQRCLYSLSPSSSYFSSIIKNRYKALTASLVTTNDELFN
jgi:hypothetical protein